MPSASFRESPRQRFVAGIEEKNFHLVPRASNLIEHARRLTQKNSFARVDHQGQPRCRAPETHELGELGEEQDGQIVDAEETGILEREWRSTFTSRTSR